MRVATKEQRQALKRVYLRTKGPHSLAGYRQFRRQAQWGIGLDCIMVPYAGMWLGIEADGYTHS